MARGLAVPLLAVTMAQARDWLATHGLRSVIIIAAALVAQAMVRHVVPPAVRRAVYRSALDTDPDELAKRAATLSDVFTRLSALALLIIAALMVLNEIGYSIAPVIAGVSITGVAIGLGAQSLVKDSINGVLILVENQFRQGDYVTVAGVSGTVEEISLRRTLLRDIDGTVHTVPNSAIVVASNHTRDYSGINLALIVPNEVDLQQAIAIAARVGEEIAADPALAPDVLDPPRPLRIEAVDEKGVTLRVLGRARPGRQAQIASEYRRRLREAYEQARLRYVAIVAPPKT
jgi:small-conductance mechanosensitive channel